MNVFCQSEHVKISNANSYIDSILDHHNRHMEGIKSRGADTQIVSLKFNRFKEHQTVSEGTCTCMCQRLSEHHHWCFLYFERGSDSHAIFSPS